MRNSTHHHLRALDGVRGVACLIVVIAHGFGLFRPSASYFAWGTGKIGVWLFFVLSAYLLTSNFLRDGVTSISLTRYAISRVVRIIPPFFCAILLGLWTNTLGITSAGEALKIMMFQNGPAHLWTIPVEFKFYLALPFIAWAVILLKVKLGRGAAALALVLAVAVHQLFFPYTQLKENSIEMIWYLPAFLIGCLGALITAGAASSASRRWIGLTVGALVIIGIVISLPYVSYILFGVPPNGLIVNKYIFYSLGWCALITCLTIYPNALTRAFSCGPLVKVGQWSYSIYLFHLFALVAVENLLGKTTLGMLVGLVSAAIFGWLMYRVIEMPCFGLRRKLDQFVVRPAIQA